MSEFVGAIREFREKTMQAAEERVRDLCLDLFSRIVLRSPVDTGRFRANWRLTVGSVPGDTLELEDKTGLATISEARASLLGVRAGDTIFLSNILPYARRLEYGYSEQAPRGMVRLSLAEISARG